MCTVSWLLANDGYQVFFNRDEQKGRALAHAPKYFNDRGVKYLMPVDPVGGGSWIAMNQAGLSICLLNYYQQKPPGKELISRGLLVKSLVSNTSLTKIRSALNKLPLQRYAAFTLLVFPSHLTTKTGDVYAVRWDGCNLSTVTAISPMVSSSVALAEVTNYREDHHNSILLQHQVLFSGEGCNDDLDASQPRVSPEIESDIDIEENIIALTNQRYLDDKNSLALTRFHASHEPAPSYLSVCMHRDDAHTVSFTHLIATRKQLKMNYVCGCPCSSKQHQSYALFPQRETYVEVV
ncbi:NRDE family protein [Moritella sp. F3]|uniref:NRDE family protein n=1 Tax=Moritella sp. F3 TaxID=2718882 RepID=UPI0018E0D666|nr:NRDE family protein [Moritella sp. F3]GIC75472.1 hypothetical protein FMO001_01990 [Moritella sp. F1]GIC80617.1 hypothetical protein FMO003_08980 [Moritella sp. F3]